MVREIPFSQLGWRPESIVDTHDSHDLEPEPEHEPFRLFEGPRYRFPLLLGQSRNWSGPLGGLDPRETGAVCRDCGRPVVAARIRLTTTDGHRVDTHVVRPCVLPAEPLPTHAYCLTCDRCGRDNAIRPATERPSRTRRVYAPDPALKGGVG
jgi:hypothetical protein